jgi:hypothetical protein
LYIFSIIFWNCYNRHIQKLMVLFLINIHHMTAASSLMDCLLDLAYNSIQYGNSMFPSMIRKLEVMMYFRKVFLLSKLKS